MADQADISLQEFDAVDESFFEVEEISQNEKEARDRAAERQKFAKDFSFRQLGSVAEYIEPVSSAHPLEYVLNVFEENPDLIVEHDDFLDQSTDQPPWRLTEWIGQIADDFFFCHAILILALFYGDLVVDLTAPLFEFVHACFGRLVEDASLDRLHNVCERPRHFLSVSL